MAKAIQKKEKHTLPKISSVETILQEVEKINKEREAAYKKDYSTHLATDKFKKESLEKAKKLHRYLTEPTNNRKWELQWTWVDKGAYINGWDMAERGKVDTKYFLEDRMADKRKSFIAGYADRLLWELIDKYKDDGLSVENSKYGSNKNLKNKDNTYTHRQIAIAYEAMAEAITTKNAAGILAKHSSLKSVDKLLQKRIPLSRLLKISNNKSTDTKLLNDLMAANRLISGMKNAKGLSDINRRIQVFRADYNRKYGD